MAVKFEKSELDGYRYLGVKGLSRQTYTVPFVTEEAREAFEQGVRFTLRACAESLPKEPI